MWPRLCIFFTAVALISPAANCQSIHDVVDDGAWCWFADPRAIVVGDHLLLGWVNSKGDIMISDQIRGQEAKESVLHKALQKDDHANPALLELPSGRVMVFYSKHTGPKMYMRETVIAGDFTNWTQERTLDLNSTNYVRKSGDLTAYTYPNPVYLKDEKLIAMTWRGMNWKPTISFSKDEGKTWSEGQILLSEKAERSANRPYVKVVSDGKSRMHFIATDGHPRNEAKNSVYHFYYEKGAFFRMDGTQIATLKSLPIRPEDCDVVYDGVAENVRSWVWDVALDRNGFPVATYTRLPKENSHEYRYASWNGHRWVDRKIVDAGGWFPETQKGKKENEPHYSGGVVLDHENPSNVYLSRPIEGIFQIERWITPDRGGSWNSQILTSGDHNSVRPVVARGLWTGGTVVFWMNNRPYIHYQNYNSRIQSIVFRSNQNEPVIDQLAASKVESGTPCCQINFDLLFGIDRCRRH